MPNSIVFSVFAKVFRKGQYQSLALLIALVVFSVAVLLPNLGLIGSVLTRSTSSLGSKISLIAELYGSIVTNFTVFSAIYTVAISILIGLNGALLVYYIRRARIGKRSEGKLHLTSVGALVSSVLGIGCAACGSVILTTLFTSFGIGGLLVYLPLHGGEFALLGIALLLTSFYYLIQKINDPLVCDVK
ncbi:MAG: hypothetical protein AAB388_02060 [Patescibacteria group bacterium]